MSKATPPVVAIVGASNQRHKFGNKAVRAFRDAGWRVFPVNLRTDRIEGLEAVTSVTAIPDDLERVSVYLHPRDTLTALDEIAEKGATEVWLNPGSADSRVQARAEALGLKIRNGCSIVDIGMSPSNYP